ncbi:MAG: hypothetical protein IJ041_01795 [Clostridia bacterium]|nr:hypothetical protein [Clostridia bacterium]
MNTVKAMVIYLDDCVLLSKKAYSGWREVQSEYGERYITSLEPMTCEEMIDFFEGDFGDESAWPFSKQRMIDFFHSGELVIQSEQSGRLD